MDAAQIEGLKALALAATLGPWRASQNDVFAGPRYRICQNVTAGGSSKGMTDERQWQLANAAFIAAAREAVPFLIAENERLTVENANLQHAFDAVKGAAPAAGAEKDAERLDFMAEHGAWIAWVKDGERCRVFYRDEDGDTVPMMGWNHPNAWHACPREAIDAAIDARTNAETEKGTQ